MPKIRYKGQDFLVRWPKGSDRILFRIGREYVKYSYTHVDKRGKKRRRNVIDWEQAQADGKLKGLPKMPLKMYSRQLSFLRAKRRWSKKYKTERRRKCREYSRNHSDQAINNMRKREKMFKNVPESIRRACGHNPKTIWNDKQRAILVRLAGMKKHRRGEIEINWELLMKHPWVKKLPEKYHKDLAGLRRYYWNVARKDRNDPEYIQRHREDALRWKHENIRKYHKNQDRRRRIVSRSVNDLLSSRIEVF